MGFWYDFYDLEILEKEKFEKALETNNYIEDYSIDFNNDKSLRLFVTEETVYDEDEEKSFFDAIAPFVKGFVDVNDQDDTEIAWRVVFNGKGNWQELDRSYYYGELYDEFIKRYKEKLPKELFEELERWNLANKI